MSQIKSVELAIELASRKRDEMAKALAHVQRQLEYARQQMEQLTGYAHETDLKWVGSPAGHMSGELVRNHYQFLDRLQQAIVLQNTVISEIEVQRSTAHQRLMQCEVRLTGLNRILENRRAAGALVTKRREQYLSDEFASMAYVRRKLEMGQGEFS